MPQVITSQTTSKESDSGNYLCGISQFLMFDPHRLKAKESDKNGECTHVFERQEISQWIETQKHTTSANPQCPCCKREIDEAIPAKPEYIKAMLDTYDNESTWNDVYFNIKEFTELVANNQLQSEMGQRYIRLLKNSASHLNELSTEEGYQDQTALEILASTSEGRCILRTDFKTSPAVLFGKSEIKPELLQKQISGQTIETYLTDWTLAKADIEEQEDISRTRLLSFYKDGYPKMPFDIVNDIMQNIAYGQRIKVKETLEKLQQSNPKLLQMVLTTQSTKPISAYSGWTIKPYTTTLLQAALRCGDIAVNENYQGAVEIISSYFDKNEALSASKIEQIKEVFPEGLETHIANQQQNAFNFDSVLAAIDKASTEELENIVKNPEKTRAQWAIGETESARTKSDQDLTLVEAMNRFRAQFAKQALSEAIPSLEHLMKAFIQYEYQLDTWTGDYDTKWLKQNLMARQIIGFIQRYLPAHEAQVFALGLYSVVKQRLGVRDTFNYYHGEGALQPVAACLSVPSLGFEHLAGPWSQVVRGAWVTTVWQQFCFVLWGTLCQAKIGNLERYINLPSSAVASTRV